MAVNSNTGVPKEKLDGFSSEKQPQPILPEKKQSTKIEKESLTVELGQLSDTVREKPKPKPTFAKKSKPGKARAVAATRDPQVLEIKNVLGKGLGPVYYKMDQRHQQEFLAEEEKAAAKIKEVLDDEPVKIRKIFKIILDWLKMIPLVNKFFLKQEAKIKTDQIVDLEKRK